MGGGFMSLVISEVEFQISVLLTLREISGSTTETTQTSWRTNEPYTIPSPPENAGSIHRSLKSWKKPRRHLVTLLSNAGRLSPVSRPMLRALADQAIREDWCLMLIIFQLL